MLSDFNKLSNFTQTLFGKNSPNITVLDSEYELPVLNLVEELVYTIHISKRASKYICCNNEFNFVNFVNPYLLVNK